MVNPFSTRNSDSTSRAAVPALRKYPQFRSCDHIPNGRYTALVEDITIFGEPESVMMLLRVNGPSHAGAELDWIGTTFSMELIRRFVTDMAHCGVNLLRGPNIDEELANLYGATLEIDFTHDDDDSYLVTPLRRVDRPTDEPPTEVSGVSATGGSSVAPSGA